VRTFGAHLRVPSPEDDDAQQDVVDRLSAFLFSLPGRPPHRAGNVISVQLFRGERVDGWSSFLVMADTDSFAPGLEEGLVEALPAGSQVMMLGLLSLIGPRPTGDPGDPDG
jgi:hypothetical protein